jgi:hypothetical protein
MAGNINDWPEFLTQVDPSSQKCTFPMDLKLALVQKPTQTNTVTGFVTYLDPEDWATEECADYVAGVLGGTVTEVAPDWDPQPVGPYQFGQKHFWVELSNGVTMDPADLVCDFIHIANKAVLEQQAIPALIFPPSS